MAAQHNFLDNPFYSPFESSYYSSDPFRFNTGGASQSLRGMASQLSYGNEGTQMANLSRQGMQQSGTTALRNMSNAALSSGGGTNYNALAGMASKIGGATNDALGGAYAKGAGMNLQGKEAGANAFAKADELDQKGKNDSLDYIAKLRPDQINPGNLQQTVGNQQGLNAYGQNIDDEDFFTSLMKGLGGGVLSGLTGGAAGWLGGKLFGQTKPFNLGAGAAAANYAGGH
jgi:hypothetical protein